MKKYLTAGAALCIVACANSGAMAQALPGYDGTDNAKQNGRYSMTPAAKGFLRLDTRSGAVSLCSVAGGQVRCQPSADERTALEAEIARLTAENSQLKKKLAQSSRPITKRLRDALPTDAEMDKALSMAERFMRRMMRIMREDNPKQDGTQL